MMNRYQSKMNFAVKSKARSFATMGAGFVDQMETLKMEERLHLMKKTMEHEREERKSRGGQFWKSGQKGKLTTYANTVLQSKITNKKVGKVKMLMDEQLNLPTRNESSSLSKKLTNISNNSTGTTHKPNTKTMKMCGQCESNEASLCCIQCTEVYCTMCFSAYHKKGALRKHRSISLEVSSTPRSKPPNSEKRLSDLTLFSMTTDTASEHGDSRSPSGASGALSLINGNYNEAESAASFQEALLAWRMNNQSSEVAGAAAAAAAVTSARGAATTSGANTVKIPPSQPKPKNNEGISTNISTNTTERKDSLASLMENNQTHTLSYAERLLLMKNRRTPISWETGTLDPTNHSEKEMKSSDTEDMSNVLDLEKMPESLGIDEPVTFSSLYNLVAQDIEESDKSSIYEEESFPGTFKNTQNELPVKANISKLPTEDFPQHRINIVPLVENVAEKHRPSLSASQSEEKNKTKNESSQAVSISSASSHRSGRKTPSQVQSLKTQRPKSRTSLSTFRATNLTTTPSKELQMVCQLAQSQHIHDDEQPSRLLMAGLSSDATTNTGEVNSSERRTSLKSNTGVVRPATTVKVSYSLYKMSPRSWHPDQSIISQNLSDNGFHLSDSFSDKSKLEINDMQSDPTSVEVQKASPFDSSPNTIRPTSTTCEESAIIMADEGEARENFTANSLYNEDLERSDSTLGINNDSLQMMRMTKPSHDLTCLNNNAVISHNVETCDPVSPKEHLKKGSPTLIHPMNRNQTVSSILTGSTTPVRSVRSIRRNKTMSPITTIHSTNDDDLATRIYSARSTPRNNSISPDSIVKKMEDNLGTPVHSVKPSPRCKTISPIPVEINSEDDVTHALSLKASTTPVDSLKNTHRDESPIPTIIDVSDNFSDTPVSVTNTARSYTMSSVPIIIEGQINHSVTPSHSMKYTPRSKTMSAIQAHQDPHERKCDTPSYSLEYTPRSKTISTLQTHQDPQEKKCDTPSYSLKYTPRSKTMPAIQTHKDPQEKKFDTPGYSLKYTPRNKTMSAIQTHQDPQEKKCDTPSYSLKYTPRSKTMSALQAHQDAQEKKCDTPSYSLKDTPRSKTMQTIQAHQGTQERCDTPIYSAKNTPRYKSMSPTVLKMQLQSSDTPTFTKTDAEEILSPTLYSLKSLRTKSTSSTSNVIEDLFETPVHSSRSPLSCKTPSSIATVIEIQDTIDPDKDTSSNKTESLIPTISDTEESISNTHVCSSIPTIMEKHSNSSVSPVLSSNNTPRTDRSVMTTASSQLEESPMSNDDEEKDKDLHYNAMIYQMMVNKELDAYTPNPTDQIVPVLPTATNQYNTINLEETNSPICTPFNMSFTETDMTNSDCSTILTNNTILLSTSEPLTCSSESVTPVLSKESLPLHDKLATTFYMCNSEMYHADNSEPDLDSTPVRTGSTLNKRPPSTKKYIIRRPPKIPDETKPQKSNSSKNDDLQPKPPSPTLSVLEMKRINFKQSNQDQKIVSLEDRPNSEQKVPFSAMNRLSLSSQGEKLNSSEEDHESVFSSLTKMSVDSLDNGQEEEEISENLFNEEEFLMTDDLQAEIDEIEDQIAEEMKVKALK